MIEQTVLSGDQNIAWDAPLKLRLLTELGYRVLHTIHSSDFFSRPPTGSGQSIAVTPEAYTPDGNVTRWTASIEAALFLGRMPINPQLFVEHGIHFERLAHFEKRPVDAVVASLTVGDWLGLWHARKERIAHGVPVADFYKELNALRKPIRRNLLESIAEPHNSPRVAVLDNLLNYGLYKTASWADASIGLLRSLIEQWGSSCSLTTSVDYFSVQNGTIPLRILELFLRHYKDAREAYNETVSGPGENILPLESGELPYYAVVEKEETLYRVDLHYPQTGKTEDLVREAARHGSLRAIVGKALVNLLELRMRCPVVLMAMGSSYAPKSARLASLLSIMTGGKLALHPVLRLHVGALDALSAVQHRFLLPEYLRDAFKTDWIDGTSFAAAWRGVVAAAEAECEQLREEDAESLLRHPLIGTHGRDLAVRVKNLLVRHHELCKSANEHPAADAEKIRCALAAEYEPQMLEAAFATLESGADMRKAQRLRELLAISQSLPYWNCRPFTSWVFALPGWYEAIRAHARVTEE